MEDLQQIPFSISVGKSYSPKNNNSDLVNLYVHIEESGAKENHILVNTSGIKELIKVDYPIKGIYEFKNTIYIATTERLYTFDILTNNLTEIGTVSFYEKVIFADNGKDIMIVGGNGYAYTPSTSTLKDMSTEDGWYPSTTVAFMDGYFIFNREGTGEFFISGLYSTKLNPIDWATAESAPDDTVGVIVASRQLWLIGKQSTEVWYDSGDADFPFTRVPGAVTDIGCPNSSTIARIRQSILFVGNDNKVYATNGYTPQIISTPAIEKRLIESDNLYQNAFTYTENGHWFYVLTINVNETYVFDQQTAQWHRRMSGEWSKWSVEGVLSLSDQNIAFTGNAIHKIDINILTENGNRIRREAVSLPLNKTVNKIKIPAVQLDMETAEEQQASVILQSSKDGGITWSNNNYAYTGKIGERLKRVRWLRLGQFRDVIFKIVITDPISIRILGLWARMTR